MAAASSIPSLPQDYVETTSADERDAHERLYTTFMQGGETVAISTQLRPNQDTLVHIIFVDCLGSLGVMCAALASRGISISRVHAFTTGEGIAVDTFQVSTFDSDAEAVLRSCLEKKIFNTKNRDRSNSTGLAGMPESYMHVTTPAERDAQRQQQAQEQYEQYMAYREREQALLAQQEAHAKAYLEQQAEIARLQAQLAKLRDERMVRQG